MGRIAENKQIGVRQEERTRIIPETYDDEGNLLTEETTETYLADVPVMGMVYRDMTEAEENENKANVPTDVPSEKTEAEQIAELREVLEILLDGRTE